MAACSSRESHGGYDDPTFRTACEGRLEPQVAEYHNSLGLLFDGQRNWQDAQVANNYLIGRDSSHLFSAQPQQFLYTKIYTNINLANAVKVLHHKGFSYILTKEKIKLSDSTIENI